jgi:hypothetical protein
MNFSFLAGLRHRRRTRSHVLVAAATVVLLAVASSCSSSGSGTTPPASGAAAARPSSPAKVTILSPKNGQIVKGSTVEMQVKLDGAKIVPLTTTNISPTQGHLHVYLDGNIVTMTAALNQKLDVTPGVHELKVEFVASDHAPFDPPVFAGTEFEVKK